VSEFPAVLCYSVEDRLAPLFAYLRGSDQIALSEEQVVTLLTRRPLLLGLAEDNVRRIVGYLDTTGSSREEGVKLLETSL
jgi:hypothetical protein